MAYFFCNDTMITLQQIHDIKYFRKPWNSGRVEIYSNIAANESSDLGSHRTSRMPQDSENKDTPLILVDCKQLS